MVCNNRERVCATIRQRNRRKSSVPVRVRVITAKVGERRKRRREKKRERSPSIEARPITERNLRDEFQSSARTSNYYLNQRRGCDRFSFTLSPRGINKRKEKERKREREREYHRENQG